jgi:replicative DNA helicase
MTREPPNFFEDERVSQLRIPPHSAESESSVLGGLLLDNGAWDRVCDLLTEADFYRSENRMIFAAIAGLMNGGRPADVITVFDELQRIGKGDEIGGLAYLSSLSNSVPSASNIRRYAEIVRERAMLRALVSASDEIATAAFNPENKSVEQILDEAQRKVMVIGESGRKADDWQEPEDGMVQFLDGIQRRADGEIDYVSTGLRDLDAKLDGGCREGEVIIIAARPSVGKTALALSVAEHMAGVERVPVGIQSMEMPKPQVQNRRVSMRSGIPYHKIRRPERMNDFEWGQMTQATEALRKVPVFVSDQTGLNINQLRSAARRLKRRRGLRGLVVDYVGLTEGTDRKANRTTQLGEVSRGIKALAKELKCTIFMLVQLKRDIETRANQRPMMSDLRECGDFEQDADVILFVHRAIHSKPDLGEEWKEYGEIIIGKQRDGESGVDVPVRFIRSTMQFVDWPLDQPIPTSKVRTGKEL